MDSPNPFLPCELQSRLLEYFRSVVEEEDLKNVQFIIVTGSIAFVSNATSEELFMLVSPQKLEKGSNQLLKVSDVNMCIPHL